MLLPFCKMHGLGNDFIVLDSLQQSFELNSEQIQRLADRHFGIGCDQLLVIEPARDAAVDISYRIFNADGEEVEQCGNGARCVAEYLYRQHGMGSEVIKAETAKGIIQLYREPDGQIKIDMGTPDFTPQASGLSSTTIQDQYSYTSSSADIQFTVVSMGNPHAVIVVEDVANYPVAEIGPELQLSSLFSNSVNVGCMQILSPDHIFLRVFERGVGETLACGSGACAAVVVGIKSHGLQRDVKVSLPGGDLMISWPDDDASVWMTGPATMVFEGTIEI